MAVEAITQDFDNLYQSLGTNEGEISIYKLPEGIEIKTRHVDQKCVKYEEEKYWFKKVI